MLPLNGLPEPQQVRLPLATHRPAGGAEAEAMYDELVDLIYTTSR